MTNARQFHGRRVDPRPQKVRIIGGRWRGVPIPIPPGPEVRPTPDRVRETLFNWLQPVIAGARCLDLFAGSGVLGLEALSRGALSVMCVERDRAVVRHLQQVVAKLGTKDLEVVAADALVFLQQSPTPMGVVFLDPPYASDVLTEVIERLDAGWLAPAAFVYLEAQADAGVPALPTGWTVHRSKRAGQVGYHLLRISR